MQNKLSAATRLALKVRLERDLQQSLALLVTHKDAKRLQKRYKKHGASVFTFLTHPEIALDSNSSERALRLPLRVGRRTLRRRPIRHRHRRQQGTHAQSNAYRIGSAVTKKDTLISSRVLKAHRHTCRLSAFFSLFPLRRSALKQG